MLAAATRLIDCGRALQPAWAAASSGNLASLPILSGVNELTLLVDRDASGEKASLALRADLGSGWAPSAPAAHARSRRLMTSTI